MSSARRSAKAEARGASPRESANFIFDFEFRLLIETSYPRVNRKFQAFVPQQLQEWFRKPLIVGASPTGGSISGEKFE